MSQSTITSYFNSRKRAAADDISSQKTKLHKIDNSGVGVVNTPQSRTTLESVKLLSNKKDNLSTSSDVTRSNKRSRAVAKLTFDQENQVSPIQNYVDAESQSLETEECDLAKTTNVSAFLKKDTNIAKTKDSSATKLISDSRKELSLGDLKQKLMNNPRFANLKASADRLSHNYQLIKSGANLKEFKSINVEVPTSPSKRKTDGIFSPKKKETEVESAKLLISPRKVVISPVKSPSKVPAYLRHAALTTTTTQLPLPHHYRALGELFRGMEQVASLLSNRKEKVTFAKLRPSVQEMLKKNFTMKHLEQIKELVPELYTFEIEKLKMFNDSSRKDAYDLLVTPLLPPGASQMTPNELLKRRRLFFERLTDVLKQHHQKFLSKLNPPMTIPNEKIVRWHPEFELEKVPEIEGSALPDMPGKETYSTAEDVLSKAREMFSCNTRMERALEKLTEAKARGLTEEEKAVTGLTTQSDNKMNVPSTSNITLINPALRNLPSSLLEKIKAKQAAKALEAMTRSTDDEKKYIIYSRLPDLARTLRNIYVTERKNVLELNLVLSKLDSSFQARVSKTDLRGDIDILTQQLPEWINYHVVRNIRYLKLNRDTNLENIKTKLNDLADKYKH